MKNNLSQAINCSYRPKIFSILKISSRSSKMMKDDSQNPRDSDSPDSTSNPGSNLIFKNNKGILKKLVVLKFGNIPTSELVLNTEGCAIFSALDIKIENKKSGLCTTNNILILSRLGRETYLQHSNKDRILKFTITSSNVVSWSLLEEKNPSAPNPE